MTERDPFSPAADPYAPTMSRRAISRALVVLPMVAGVIGGCGHLRPACATRPEAPEACHHRFCRYYAG